MSIAVITSTEDTTNARFDRRFGRAAWFCLYHEESGKTEFIQNEFKDANGGAGTKVAAKMAELQVTKVISGDFGPKAKDLLEELNIQMVIINENEISVDEIIKRMQQ